LLAILFNPEAQEPKEHFPAMTPANVVLLPKVFPSDLVSLGQLLRNPLAPNINSYANGCSMVTDADVSMPNAEEPYSTMVSTDTRGRFDIGLTKYLGVNFKARSTSLLSIEADKLVYRTLKNAPDVFKRICAVEETKRWINDMVLNKAPCYFVIGVQELHNAKFKRAILKDGGVGVYVTVPLEATSHIPLHVKGELAADRFGSSVAAVNGVFGIQVQKLQCKIGPSGEPNLRSDVSWHWSYQRLKGTQQEEDKQLHIELGDVDLSELLELLKQDDEDDEDGGDNGEE
jgi:hypothetical protein